MNCIDSFTWCKPATINETDVAEFYQDLKSKCESKGAMKSCCLDSVKAMEVVGAVHLAHSAKDISKNDCQKGEEYMTLRCPGSYAWCQPDNGIPGGAPVLPTEPNLPSPGPGFDDEGNGPICTQEAKSCGDGTYVGRTGPNCEFAPCPGEKPTADFTPTKDNPIQLPSNVISEKECTARGGEVWNTLGQTSYNGELIGKIEGLKCPCACLVRDSE